MKQKMKIGVLTYHRAINYGAFLQAYGLCERLNQEPDFEAELIDFQCKAEVDLYRPIRLKRDLRYLIHTRRPKYDWQYVKRCRAFAQDRKRMHLSRRHVVSSSSHAFTKMVQGKYDVIVAGSDEIWKVNSFRGFPTPYWLLGDLGCRKFSYAASARTSFDLLSPQQQETLKNALDAFEYIGVRDLRTLQEVERYVTCKEKVHLCCDPSFVYEFQADGRAGRALLQKRYGIAPEEKCIGCMIGSNELVNALQKRYGTEVKVISLFEKNAGCIQAADLTPFEWLDVIAGLDFVVTSYFHGMCFSIVNQTPFFSIDNRTVGTDGSKMLDLLQRASMEDRYEDSVAHALETGRLFTKIEEAFAGISLDSSAFVAKNRAEFTDFIGALRMQNR